MLENAVAMQTPATRFLDDAGIPYELHRYEHDPSAQSYGLEAAERLGLDPGVVFKTLMAQLDNDPKRLAVGIVGVGDMLDVKALARAAGAKRAAMAPIDVAERVSGYVAGGISPFGQKRQLPTYIDETAEICDRIYVSGGQRGLDLSVAPGALIAALDAVVAPIAT